MAGGARLVKAALITPAYLSVAWVLMVSYQVFTQTAVTTVVTAISPFVPTAATWLTARMDIIVFIYAFAWVFVLTSIIPSLILGKERSVLVQFFVCLVLTLTGFILLDMLKSYGFDLSDPNVLFSNPITQLFTNAIFAGLYLSLPYIFMLAIDLNARKKGKQKNQKIKSLTDEHFSRKQQTQA
jgi:hypothetical protein